MTLWILVPFLILVAVVQIAWLPLVPIFGFKIDLALIVVVAWGLIGPFGQAAQWGFIVGIILDLASGLPFGIHTFTLTLIGLLVGWGQRTFFRGNLITPPAMMFAATLLDHVLILGFLSLSKPAIPWGDYLLRITLPTAVLNTLAAVLVYFPLAIVQRRLYRQIDFQ